MKQEEKECNKAIQLYRETGLSITKLAKQLKLDRGRLSIEMKKLGVTITNVHNSVKFDNTAFDVIDTEEKAYWLGFLFADGNVSKGKRNAIEISLALKDINHLEKYNLFLKNTIAVKKDGFRCRCAVVNKHMKHSLISLGCVPAKSLILKYPTLDSTLNSHFIRGYFDGDGYIGIIPPNSTKIPPKSEHVSISLLGTENMLSTILNLSNISKVLYTKKGINVAVKRFCATRKQAMKFLDFIYKDATVYLERKYNKYLIAKTIQNKRLPI